MRKAVAVLGVACFLALAAGPAGAKQMDAADDPRVRGPLSGGVPDCDSKLEQRDGETIAKVKLCARLYAFDPASESDVGRDYGVLWVQTNVDARNGWCTRKVNTGGLVRTGGTVHAVTPGQEYKTKTTKKLRLKLIADAEGFASEAGTVAKTFDFRPRSLTRVNRKTDDGLLVKARWRGLTAAKLGFAMGIEISWDSAAGSPGMRPKLGYRFVKKGTC